MAKCNCAGNQCGCSLIVASDPGSSVLTISGVGTKSSPFTLSINLTGYQKKPGFVRKAADQNVISSTVLVAAADLTVPVLTLGQYLVEAQLFYTAATGGDIKVGFTAPAGATMDWTMVGLGVAAAAVGDALVGAGVAVIGGTHSRGGVAAKVAASIRGILTVDATAGDLALTFAQDTSVATNTTLHAGSTLRATPLNF